MSNITQVVNTDKYMKTLKKGVHYSDLDQLLSRTGPFTFFAPTDLAFERQGHDYMDSLLTPDKKAELTDLLNGHIVDGKISYQDLKDGDRLKTIKGNELVVEIKNGKVSIDGVAITAREQRVSNGVVHLSDGVLGKRLVGKN